MTEKRDAAWTCPRCEKTCPVDPAVCSSCGYDSRPAPTAAEPSAATRVVCPFCHRNVETFVREGVELMFGHRVEVIASVAHPAPWCEGGGRAPR